MESELDSDDERIKAMGQKSHITHGPPRPRNPTTPLDHVPRNHSMVTILESNIDIDINEDIDDLLTEKFNGREISYADNRASPASESCSLDGSHPNAARL